MGHRRAPALVAVPGLGLSAASLRPLLRRLPLDSEVVELPGYGQSATRAADLSPAVLGAALAVRLPPSPVVLLGHSASCQIVAEAAAVHPVSALVLVGPTTDPRAATWPRLAARWLRTAAHEPAWQLPLLLRDYARTGLVTMGRAMDAARRHDATAALARAGCPVLVVRGRHDAIAPADWCAGLGLTVTLPSGGHMVPLTRGPDAAAAVRAHTGATRHGGRDGRGRAGGRPPEPGPPSVVPQRGPT